MRPHLRTSEQQHANASPCETSTATTRSPKIQPTCHTTVRIAPWERGADSLGLPSGTP